VALKRTEGIVLKSAPFGEADLIVTYLTKDFGLIRTFAKSPRKAKSRFGASLEPLTCSRISFFGREDASLPRLTQSDIIESFQGLRESLDAFACASETTALILELLPEGEPNRKAFWLLRAVLKLMEALPGRRGFLVLLFKIRLLDMAGYSPLLKHAAAGQRGHGPLRYWKLHENMRTWEFPAALRIKPSSAMMGELKSLIDAHIKEIL